MNIDNQDIQDKDQEPRGIYGKYVIQKTSGEKIDPKAVYFTLRLDTDPYARAAMLRYAEACQDDQPELARDILVLLGELVGKKRNTVHG